MNRLHIQTSEVVRDGRAVLRDIDLGFESGRMVGLVGPNGAGKSTLVGCVAGQLPLADGRLSLGQQNLTGHSARDHALWRALLSQQADINFNLTVQEVIEIGLHVFEQIRGQQRLDLIAQAAQLGDVHDLMDRAITTLSAGQQQRVHLARTFLHALAIKVVRGRSWLLLDEPVSNQDPWQQQRVLHACRKLCEDGSMGMLLVLHDLSLVRRWCDDVVALAQGAVVAAGVTSQVLTPEVIARTYGARVRSHFFDDPVPGLVLWSDFEKE